MSIDQIGHPWRRVIAYIAWGEQFVRLAAKNSASAMFLGIPIILITDREGARFIPEEHPFSNVVEVERFRSYDMLAKSTIYDLVPDEYDSILYLDTDTVVLKDITFGFEMAERYGIALCPATSYCLPSHHDFRRIMIDSGLPDVGQVQYNAGVHFFVRRPDVKDVYDFYQKCSYELSEKFKYRNARGKLADQPFLSFAMEMLTFNPYTLSINYCYRGLDAEPACGDIRIWHSHHPVPLDINKYESHAGPRRRFYQGKLIDMLPIYTRLRAQRS